jgi:3',5'-cyclic AMP phosphodiesterase CpdA
MIRILHISDLHLGKTKDRNERNQRLLKKIIERYPLDKNTYFMITGDIIDNWDLAAQAWKKQYELAENVLESLKTRALLVPGNHDYAFAGFVFDKKYSDFFDDPFAPYFGISHKFRLKKPWRIPLDDGAGTKAILIGLNSCLMTSSPLDLAKGEIGEEQRKALAALLDDPADKDVPKIVYLHHIPHRRAEGIGMSLRDYKELMKVVRNKAAALAFGHEGSMKDPSTRKLIAPALPPRPMRVREGRRQGIKYYLDANMSVEEQSCYCVEIDKGNVVAKLVKF